MSESWRQNQALVDDDKPVAAVVEGDWDDSEEEEAAPLPKPAQKAKPAPKQQQPQPKTQAPVKKAPEYVEPTPEQVAAEIRASRLADAEDLFGLNEKEERKTKSLAEDLDQVSLSTEEEYRAFAGFVASRIEVEKRGNHKRMTFLRELLKAASTPLSAEEVNELKSSLNVVFNEKKKAMTSKKKPKKAGKSLKVGGLEDDYDDGQVYEEDY